MTIASQKFLHVTISKQKRDNDEDEHCDKIPRAFAALIAEELDANDYNNIEEALAAFTNSPAMSKINILTPTTYKQTVKNPVWGKLWQETIQAELNALQANGTWEEIMPSKGVNIVTSKWVFKPKLHSNGSLNKLKVRLMARGFSQVYSVNFEGTFALIFRFDTLCLFLTIVALKDLECHIFDVNNVFTESILKEDIYMAPLSGVDISSDKVFQVLWSLYGLKQAAQDWHEKCITEMIKLSFQQCAADSCLLIHYQKKIMVLLYVDDISIAFKQLNNVLWFKSEFQKIFKIKDLREMKKILGINITCNRKARTLCMNQSHYLNNVLEQLDMRSDKHRSTELLMNSYASLYSAGSDNKRTD